MNKTASPLNNSGGAGLSYGPASLDDIHDAALVEDEEFDFYHAKTAEEMQETVLAEYLDGAGHRYSVGELAALESFFQAPTGEEILRWTGSPWVKIGAAEIAIGLAPEDEALARLSERDAAALGERLPRVRELAAEYVNSLEAFEL